MPSACNRPIQNYDPIFVHPADCQIKGQGAFGDAQLSANWRCRPPIVSRQRIRQNFERACAEDGSPPARQPQFQASRFWHGRRWHRYRCPRPIDSNSAFHDDHLFPRLELITARPAVITGERQARLHHQTASGAILQEFSAAPGIGIADQSCFRPSSKMKWHHLEQALGAGRCLPRRDARTIQSA